MVSKPIAMVSRNDRYYYQLYINNSVQWYRLNGELCWTAFLDLSYLN